MVLRLRSDKDEAELKRTNSIIPRDCRREMEVRNDLADHDAQLPPEKPFPPSTQIEPAHIFHRIRYIPNTIPKKTDLQVEISSNRAPSSIPPLGRAGSQGRMDHGLEFKRGLVKKG